MQPDQNNSLEPQNEQVQEPIKKNYFEAFYTSTLGIFAALVVIAIIFFAGMGLVYWGHKAISDGLALMAWLRLENAVITIPHNVPPSTRFTQTAVSLRTVTT